MIQTAESSCDFCSEFAVLVPVLLESGDWVELCPECRCGCLDAGVVSE